MMREVMAHSQVMTVFQNGMRFQANKLHKSNKPDMSIRWLIDAYDSLQASRETIMIVPINISLDRIYESANIATEMINGEREYYTLFSFMG